MSMCSICIERGIQQVAVVWCPNCGDQLCQNCKDHHKISKASKDHKTTSIERYQELPKFVTDLKLICEEHNTNFSHYCKQHEIAICVKCLLPDHKDCFSVVAIEQAVTNVQSSVILHQLEQRINETIQNTEKATKEVAFNIDSLIDNSTEIETNISKKRLEINSHFDKLETQAKNCVLAIKNDNQSKLKSIQSDLKVQEKHILELRELLKKMKEHGNDLQVFLGISELEKQLQEHMKHTSDIFSTRSIAKVSMEFQIDNLLMNLAKSIPQLGKISMSTTQTPLQFSLTDKKAAQFNVEQVDNSEIIVSDIFRVAFDYDAKESDELTITSGDIVMKLTNDSTDEWMFCRKLDFKRDTFFEGLVPFNFLKREIYMYQFKWFVGEITEEDKQKIFQLKDNTNGSFIVSGNELTGKYTLLVKTEGSDTENVLSYPISKTGSLGNKTFSVTTESGKTISGKSLEEVIEYLKDSCSGIKECIRNPCLRVVDDWDIKRENLEKESEIPIMDNRLKIFAGRWNKSVPVHIQSFPKDKLSCEFYKAEVDVLTQCHHTNMVKLYGVSFDSDAKYIVKELAPHGSLDKVVKQTKKSFQELIKVAIQVSSGLAYLEKRKIVYADFAIDRVWVFEDNVVKLGEFHVAVKTDGRPITVPDGFKYRFRTSATELLFARTLSTKSDVWAFGIFLMELTLGGGKLYSGLNNTEVVEKLEDGYRHPKPKGCPQHLYDVAYSCWNKNPEKRPTFEYLNSFLDDYSVSIEHYYEEVEEEDYT